MVKSCAALGCTYDWSSGKSDDANISFHKFPLRHPDLLETWTARIGRSAFIPTEHSRLCSRHFQRSDFNNPDAPKHRRLRDDAVPSLNLPNFPSGDGVGGCLSEDPRLHATMAPAERNTYASSMGPLLANAPSSSTTCNASHSNVESTPRDSLDWLNNNSHQTFSDTDNGQDDWPPALQQQQPVITVNVGQSTDTLAEKQMDQVGHRAIHNRNSPNILSTDSLSSDEEDQPSAKRHCPGGLQVDCDIDAMDVQSVTVRHDSVADMRKFQCSTPNVKSGHLTASTLTQEQLSPMHAKLKKRKVPCLKPVSNSEKTAAQTSSWDGLWANIGNAVRVVAEAMAFFMLTKADIAREKHQMQMEQCRRRLQQSSCAFPNSCHDWVGGSDINTTNDSESEPGEVENLLQQNNCLKAEPDDMPRE